MQRKLTMNTETNAAIGEVVEHAGLVTEEDLARLITNLKGLEANDLTPARHAASSVTRICETWPRRVRVARYTDVGSFEAIATWIQELHRRGQLQPGVEFTVEDDPGVPRGLPRGVLYDPNADPIHRWAVLRRGQYVVYHGDKTLEALDEYTLHARYRYPDQEPAPNRSVGF
jgi:hypothetical protein